MNDALAVEHEVVRLHRFFQGWFAGDAGLAITEFSDVLDDGFTIVSPSGVETGRTAVIAAVQGAFGSSSVAITIKDVTTTVIDGSVICRYVEVQLLEGAISRRISTAVLRMEEGQGGRPVWLTVHETWIGSQDVGAS